MVLWQLTIDANDPTVLARIWAQAPLTAEAFTLPLCTCVNAYLTERRHATSESLRSSP
jgi:hypothetical protein